jgi:hypothetical protein
VAGVPRTAPSWLSGRVTPSIVSIVAPPMKRTSDTTPVMIVLTWMFFDAKSCATTSTF